MSFVETTNEYALIMGTCKGREESMNGAQTLDNLWQDLERLSIDTSAPTSEVLKANPEEELEKPLPLPPRRKACNIRVVLYCDPDY